MTRSSQNSGPLRRSKAEKEAWALKAVFNAMYAVGVSVSNVDEAVQAIELAARMLSYALRRKVGAGEVRERMVQLLEEEWAKTTKH